MESKHDPPRPLPPAAGHRRSATENVIDVQHDSQRGVTCYLLNGVGISCIPDSQLQAGNQRQLSPHETQPEPTPALAPGRWIDERYQL